MSRLAAALSLAFPVTILIHLFVAPYTKVEESFSIQATHDILVYGMPTSNIHEKLSRYDHFDFPGAVPRTFIGPVLIAGVSQPIVALVGFEYAQLVVRAVLGLFNAFSLMVLTSNFEKAFGKGAAIWFVILQTCQFHVMFYASRTLPNMFAFGLTTIAFSQLLPHPNPRKASGRYSLTLSCIACAGVVFRSEIAILLGTTAFYLLVKPYLSFHRIIKISLISVIFSLGVSVPIDSYFWQKPLWPELWGFYYNVVLGSSSNWGISPWHYYFTSALPKLLLNPLVPTVLIPTALYQPATSRTAQLLTIPTLAFVTIYSLQPHKEARFILYVIPPLTAAAALGANYIFSHRSKSAVFTVLTLALVASIPISIAGSLGLLLISSLNYPGGEALAAARSMIDNETRSSIQTVSIHTDVLSCMTGVTLFGQHAYPPNEPPPDGEGVTLRFDKTEDEGVLRDPAFWTRFDYALAEDPRKVLGKWKTIGTVEGFAGVELIRPGTQKGGDDVESGENKLVGKGAVVRDIRDWVRTRTGGWWVGPRMEPKVRILRRLREGGQWKEVKE